MPATKNTLPRFVLAAVVVSTTVGLISVAHRAEAQKPAFSLSDYRDKNRLALVFAPSKSDKRFVKPKALWEKNDGFADRDLVKFYIVKSGKSTAGSAAISPGDAAALRRRFGIKSGFRVLLVGKDGHAAYSTEYPADADNLFRRIDKMPMRRDEIRRRGR